MSAAFHIGPGLNTPEVIWDPQEVCLSLTGKLFPENTDHFFGPLKEKLAAIAGARDVKLRFHLDYLNSSSVIGVLDLLRHFENSAHVETVVVMWHYDQDDDEMLKLGEDFQQLSTLSFQFIEVKEV